MDDGRLLALLAAAGLVAVGAARRGSRGNVRSRRGVVPIEPAIEPRFLKMLDEGCPDCRSDEAIWEISSRVDDEVVEVVICGDCGFWIRKYSKRKGSPGIVHRSRRTPPELHIVLTDRVWRALVDGDESNPLGQGYFDTEIGYPRQGGSGRGAAVSTAYRYLGFNKVSDKEMRKILLRFPAKAELVVDRMGGLRLREVGGSGEGVGGSRAHPGRRPAIPHPLSSIPSFGVVRRRRGKGGRSTTKTISMSYAVTTEASLEEGDFVDSGFFTKDEDFVSGRGADGTMRIRALSDEDKDLAFTPDDGWELEDDYTDDPVELSHRKTVRAVLRHLRLLSEDGNVETTFSPIDASPAHVEGLLSKEERFAIPKADSRIVRLYQRRVASAIHESPVEGLSLDVVLEDGWSKVDVERLLERLKKGGGR